MRSICHASTFCLFALICAVPGLVLGAAAPLTAEMAVERALANSPELSAETEEIKGLHEAAEKIPLLANPILELEGKSGAITNSPDEKSASIAILQEIPLSAAASRRRAVARADAAAVGLRLEERKLRLADLVRRIWSASVIEQQRLELLGTQTEVVERLLKIAQERFTAGDLPEFEVQLAQLELHRQTLRQTEQQAALLSIRRQLATLLGLPGEQELPPLAPATLPTPTLLADEQLLTLATQRRPDLAAMKKEAERDEASLSLAKAEAFPSLTLGLSYSNERSSQNAYDLQGGLLVAGKERTNDHILGLKLSIPLPLFSRNQAEVAKATGRVNANHQRVAAVHRTARAELRDLLAQHRLAITALELHRSTLGPVARENLITQEAAFTLGEIGIQPVLDEKRRLAEQQDAELKALQMALETDSRLIAAVGGRLTDRGDTP
jgi:cobalt-zinc-cadmium efflux system outer membrane protein